MRGLNIEDFIESARLFPLSRPRRTGPAYAWIVADPDGRYKNTVEAIREGLKTDPHAADLWFNLGRMALKRGDEAEYTEAKAQVQRLVPHAVFEVIERGSP